MSEGDVCTVARRLLTGAAALHAASIVHCDLHPGNVALWTDELDSTTIFDLGQWRDSSEFLRPCASFGCFCQATPRLLEGSDF